MSKKAILSLVLIGMLAFGAGIGTYAYFSSVAVSENNEFEIGTFKFDGVDDNYVKDIGQIFLPDFVKQPQTMHEGYLNNYRLFDLQNGGSLPMNLMAETDFTLTNADGTVVEESDSFYNEFRHLVYLNYNGEIATLNAENSDTRYTINEEDGTVTYNEQTQSILNYGAKSLAAESASSYGWIVFTCAANELDEALNYYLGGLEFASNETLHFDISTWLNHTAGNEYQGANLSGSLTIKAKQTNATWEDTYPTTIPQ